MVYIYLFIYFLFCSVYLLLYQVMIFMFTNGFLSFNYHNYSDRTYLAF